MVGLGEEQVYLRVFGVIGAVLGYSGTAECEKRQSAQERMEHCFPPFAKLLMDACIVLPARGDQQHDSV
jgi:hypothetical protein